jgi:hypothetical protein
MEVKRVEEDGLALAFVNVTGRHLWQSVDRLRSELAIGQDFFQVHLNVLVTNPYNAILLAQQHGKWTFPATYLEVGQSWQGAVETFLAAELSVKVTGFGQVVAMNSVGYPELPEAAVLDLFVEAQAADHTCKLAKGSRYRSARWTDRRRDVEEGTFASDRIRELADAALKRLIKDEGQG